MYHKKHTRLHLHKISREQKDQKITANDAIKNQNPTGIKSDWYELKCTENINTTKTSSVRLSS